MTDNRVILLVVAILGAICILALAGSIWLLHDGTEGAEIVVVAGFGTTALGSLASLLVSTKTAADPGVGQAIDHAVAAAQLTGQKETEAAMLRLDQSEFTDDAGAVETAVCIVLCVLAFFLGWLAHSAGLFT